MNLTNQHVLVTGAGSGVGLAIARQLDKLGCRITLCGRNEGPLIELSSSLDNAQYFTCDVTDRVALDDALNQARQSFGPFQLLLLMQAVLRHARLAKFPSKIGSKPWGLILMAVSTLFKPPCQIYWDTQKAV